MTFKKAACLKLVSCKKKAPPNGGRVEPQHPPANRMMMMPSLEEAALTSKNYRLAKALVDIQVRHREECENTSRLMMENRLLATKCREVIRHVPMLEKELAVHRRRAADALLLQREHTQRMASQRSAEQVARRRQSSAEVSRLSQLGAEDTGENSPIGIGRIWAATPSPPPPPPPKKATRVPPNVAVGPQVFMRPKRELFLDIDEDDTVAETISPTNEGSRSERNYHVIDESPKAMSKPNKRSEGNGVTQKVYSTPNRHRTSGFTPQFGAPLYASNGEGKGICPPSASPTVGVSRPNHYNEAFPPDIIPQSQRRRPFGNQDDPTSGSSSTRSSFSSSASTSFLSQNSLQQRRGIIGRNSIDAFEASFDTTFPEAVTPNESEPSKRNEPKTVTPTSSDIYNTFAPSPARPAEKTEGRTGRSPLPGTQSSTSLSSRKLSNPGSPVVIRKAYASDASMFGNPNTPEEKKTPDPTTNEEDQCHTPPQEKSFTGVVSSEEPKRPEKSVSKVARARYEKVIQARRRSTSSITPNEKSTPPSLTVETPGESYSLSIRRLNAIKNRRSAVKQSLSYAEPALHTKLGDTYIPKPDDKPQIVTPEQVLADSVLG